MTFDEAKRAIDEACRTLRAANSQANEMASILSGRLKSSGVSAYTLDKLKRELRDFNLHTGQWK